MCGIVGFISPKLMDAVSMQSRVEKMAAAVLHRGPDDYGVWTDAEAGVALAHRRLSIIDLSQAGHQPMPSDTGRFVIAFNGEIYNHLHLRQELEAVGAAPRWRGHSDTETLLAAFEHWGLEATLDRTVGMFAIALWDKRERTLSLMRDRFGEKPLYYGWVGGAFVFGSELKSLRAFPEFENRISEESLAQYMRFLYVPAPRSIYCGIYKLEPGCHLKIAGSAPEQPPVSPLRPGDTHGQLCIHRWWSLARMVERGAKSQIRDEADAIIALDTALTEAVSLQSVADVPLGAFLSGGIDSSTIVALMQKHSRTRVNTFTVGFEEKAYDESDYARAVAVHLGTLHTELFVTSAETRDVIALLPEMYDEPFADSSQIPTHLICRAARKHVTVAMSGDAGDELFGGYNRYLWGPRMWRSFGWLPFHVRKAVGALIGAVPGKGWDAVGSTLNQLLPGQHQVAGAGDKARKLSTRLQTLANMGDLYLSLVSEWQDPALVVRSHDGALIEPPSLLGDPAPAAVVNDGQSLMMFRDTMTYLPDDILCKLDRAAMATSLETRVPFLDHRLAELAWRLPLDLKIRNGQGKWILRQVLHRYVPAELVDRPKTGFGVPIGDWLRGPLREWAESLLDEDRLNREGHFHTTVVRAKWLDHLHGRNDHTASLWSILMFQAWLERSTSKPTEVAFAANA